MRRGAMSLEWENAPQCHPAGVAAIGIWPRNRTELQRVIVRNLERNTEIAHHLTPFRPVRLCSPAMPGVHNKVRVLVENRVVHVRVRLEYDATQADLSLT